MKLQDFCAVIVTSDEPYSEMQHTQLLYAKFLSEFVKVIFLEPPSKWKLSKLFTASADRQDKKLTILPYFNPLPSRFRTVNDRLNEKRLIKLLPVNEQRPLLVWHFDSYRSVLNDGCLRKKYSVRHIYHVIDPFYTNPANAQLCEIADVIAVTSPRNVNYYADYSSKVIQIPQGLWLKDVYKELAKTSQFKFPEPYVVMLGTLSDDLELDYIETLLLETKVHLVLAGKKIAFSKKADQFARISGHPRVHVVGSLLPEEFYPLLKNARAGLIAYDLKIRATNFSPLKALNYLAAGLPVISNVDTEIEASESKGIFTSSSVKQFADLVNKAIQHGFIPVSVQTAQLQQTDLPALVQKILDKLS